MNANWVKRLPAAIRRRIEGRLTLQAVIGNAGWLMADKMLRAILGLLVMAWIARYLGPDGFGLLNYATAFVALLAAVGVLGVDGIAVRELSLHPERRDEILGSALGLRLFGGGLVVTLATIAAVSMRPGHDLFLGLVVITALASVFQAVDVADNWFLSQTKSKYTVVAKGTVFVVFCGLKVVLILLGAPLLAFAAIATAEIACAGFALLFLFQRNYGSVRQWRFRAATAAYLLREGWPLMLAFMAYSIYARIDQVMIGSLAGDRDVGLYAASTKIVELFVSAVLMVATSLFPTLSRIYRQDREKFDHAYETITTFLTWFGVLCCALMLPCGEWVLRTLMGEGYIASYPILAVQMIGFVFVANGGLRSSYFTISGNQRVVLHTTLIAAALNLAMNFFLIPLYGALGAAIASTATQAVSLFLLNLAFREARPLFFIQARALNPLRLVRRR